MRVASIPSLEDRGVGEACAIAMGEDMILDIEYGGSRGGRMLMAASPGTAVKLT